LGIEPIALPLVEPRDIELALEKLAQVPGTGLVSPPDIFILTNRDMIISAANRHNLPTIFIDRFFVANGGLASYGANQIDIHRNAASYVDPILRGEKTTDLPVQTPTKYELVINLKTAKALGLDIPATVLARADEVIE
jgi:putative ABC transport system substrate-binding protein